MWKRKKIKSQSRKSLKANYGRAIAVCFIIACLTSAYAGSLSLIESYDPNNEATQEVVNDVHSQSSAEIVDDFVVQYLDEHPDATDKDIKKIELVDKFIGSFFSSGSATSGILKLVNNFISDKKFNFVILFLIIGYVLKVLYSIFIGATLQQGEKRFFLENRYYNNTKIPKLFYLFRLRYVKHTAWVLLKKWIFNTLWWFTIIGGPIKLYEYRMIPYIIAENPKVTAKDAFALSKKMMKGNKWKTFILDLTFIGWNFLGMITLGLVSVFYVNPYKAGTNAELYMFLRNKMKESDSLLKNCMNDDNLEPTPEFVLANEGVYPYQLYTIPQEPRKPINAMRKYSISSLILLFFIFSFVGWCYEVGIHLVTDGVFVNRGTLLGPWLPIYGSGGVMVIVLMRKWMKNPILTFFLTMFICSVVEYFSSWYLEQLHGIRWWDYSGYFMNLNGRICLLGATVFGIGGCAFLYFIAPKLDDLLIKIPKGIKWTICTMLLGVFGCDAGYSYFHPNTGFGITDYGYLDNNKEFVGNTQNNGIKRLKG